MPEKLTCTAEEFDEAMEEMNEEMQEFIWDIECRCSPQSFFTLSSRRGPIQLKIKIFSFGTQDSEQTEKWARVLLKASELADEFKYNGYVMKG